MRRLTPNRARAAAARAPHALGHGQQGLASVYEGAAGSRQACEDVCRLVKCAQEKCEILVCLEGKGAMRRLTPEPGARRRRARAAAPPRALGHGQRALGHGQQGLASVRLSGLGCLGWLAGLSGLGWPSWLTG